jgi:glycosyltransferase involved in cell wall biosynthesis
MMGAANLISVVLPAYNEEENIFPFFEALRNLLEAMADNYRYEIIYVNDGSRDRTLELIRELTATHDEVKLISLSRNFGHQAALTAGVAHARGDAVITMDCDFQDPPELIPKLIAEWEAGNQIVYARRTRRDDTFFKKITAELYYRSLQRLSDLDIPRQVADYRLMDRMVVDSFLKLGEHARYLRGMVAWLGFRHTFVDFERPERIHGETHYPLVKMMRFAMDGILSFSFKPLRLAMWVGVVSMSLAVLFFSYMLFDHFVKGVPYPLFKWLVVLLFGFMGAQFILLWIMGEYVARIVGEVRHRPLYIVAERVNVEPQSPPSE